MSARSILVWLGACGALLAACRSAPAPAPPSGRKPVVIIESAKNRLFEAPVRAFRAGLDADFHHYSLDEIADLDDLASEIRRLDPSLLFVLGTRATLYARDRFADVPVAFTMVVNYRRLGLEAHTNFMGVGLEVPPLTEFTLFKMVAPDLRRVLAFYVAAESRALVEEAKKQLETVGIELHAVAVGAPGDVPRLFAEHAAGVDGVWFLNDPVLSNPATFAFLADQTSMRRLPFLSSMSDRFAEAGALVSVSVDLNALGSQAAASARRVLEHGVLPAAVGVEPPIGSSLAVNLDVADVIGLEIPSDALQFVNRIVSAREKEPR